MAATNEVLVIGIGNEFRSDDAAGLVVAGELAGHSLLGVTVLSRAGGGAELLEAWKEWKRVIVIDAVFSGGAPGTLHRVDTGCRHSLKSLATMSTHGLGLAEAIKIGEAVGQLPEELVIYGIEGKSFDPGCGLSPEVRESLDCLVGKIVEELKCMSTALPGT